MGQKASDGKWEAIPLSMDQTGHNKEEIARLHNEHPGEEDVVKDGRELGMMVSRAFGDGQRKWPLELHEAEILWTRAPGTKVRHSNTTISDC